MVTVTVNEALFYTEDELSAARQSGYDDGYETGYEESFQSAWDDGNADGFYDGRVEGSKEGWNDCLNYIREANPLLIKLIDGIDSFK